MEKSIFTPEYTALSRVLVRRRKAAGVTQVELAEALKTTQSALSKLERGALRLDLVQLRAVCKVLGMSLVELVQEFEQELASPLQSRAGGRSRMQSSRKR